MRLWSDLEIDLLIDEISEAALEAIEQAAGEAAKAAVLSMVEREAELLRELTRWRQEAETAALEVTQSKRDGRKNTVLGVVIGILGGFAVGVTGTLIIGGR
jgi:PP-loop superfamily ATP-utilizing enzyme